MAMATTWWVLLPTWWGQADAVVPSWVLATCTLRSVACAALGQADGHHLGGLVTFGISFVVERNDLKRS